MEDVSGRQLRGEPLRCPVDGSRLVQTERSEILVDACPECRGVWLDRGELDRILERERQVVGGADDEDFIREMTGGGKEPKRGYGFDARTAERIYSDYRTHKKHKKRKSFLDELFD
jgi:uncharacterized protein